jgi:CRP-like cAMP-binding protein
MQNIKLPLDLQSRIVGFLQFTQKSQENQKELKLFIQNISPSLKHQVIEFIFKIVIENNSMFQNDKQLVNILFSKMELLMYDPEEVIIRQGQLANQLFFISKGECEVTVADENRKDTFV